MNDKISKKTIVIIVTTILAIIGIIVFAIFLSNPTANSDPGTVYIPRLSEEFPNLPEKNRDLLQRSLHNIIKANNNEDFDPTKVVVAIRTQSTTSNFSRVTNIYSGSFIVDAATLRQSYLLTFEWSSDPDINSTILNPATARCVPENRRAYDDFGCVDAFDGEGDENANLIFNHLPYGDRWSFFGIIVDTANSNEDSDKVSLIVTFSFREEDFDSNGNPTPEALSRYQEHLEKWFIERALNIDDYNIIIAP